MSEERTTVRRKHPLAIRWFHWMNFLVLADERPKDYWYERGYVYDCA